MFKKFLPMLLVLLITAPAVAPGAPGAADLQAMEVILKLTQAGMVAVDVSEPNGGLYVEPQFWKQLTHVQKSILLKQGMLFFLNANSLQKKNIEWVGVADMTTKENLGSINLQKHTISVKK